MRWIIKTGRLAKPVHTHKFPYEHPVPAHDSLGDVLLQDCPYGKCAWSSETTDLAQTWDEAISAWQLLLLHKCKCCVSGRQKCRKVEFRPRPGCEEATDIVCSQGEGQIHSGSSRRRGCHTLTQTCNTETSLMEEQLAPHTPDKVLVMERECLVCHFPQAAHQLNLTFSFSYNVTASDIFHPKSHKRLIWLNS